MTLTCSVGVQRFESRLIAARVQGFVTRGARRLANAIAEMGHSPSLPAKLGEVDEQIIAVDRRMDQQKPIDLTATVAEMREVNLGSNPSHFGRETPLRMRVPH